MTDVEQKIIASFWDFAILTRDEPKNKDTDYAIWAMPGNANNQPGTFVCDDGVADGGELECVLKNGVWVGTINYGDPYQLWYFKPNPNTIWSPQVLDQISGFIDDFLYEGDPSHLPRTSRSN